MKLKLIIATGTTALLAVIGAVQVWRWACALTATALAYWGEWNIAEAAQAAPWILLALGAGLAMSLYWMHEDNKRYATQGYGRIQRDHARNPEYPENQERGA